MADDPVSCLIKIVLLGDARVGKSALMQAYTKSTTCDETQPYTPTHGVEFCSGYSAPFGKRVQFQIWDTAGDPRFRAPTEKYCLNAAGCACVYDRTNRKSFESCAEWLWQARQACGEQSALALVGTKSDLLGGSSVLHEISSTEGRKLAKEHGAQYYETGVGANLETAQQFFAHFIAVALRCKMDQAEATMIPEEQMFEHEAMDSRLSGVGCTLPPAAGEFSHDEMIQFVEELVHEKSAVEQERDQLRSELEEAQARTIQVQQAAALAGLEGEITELSGDRVDSQEYSPYHTSRPAERVPTVASCGVLCDACGWGSPTLSEVCERCGKAKPGTLAALNEQRTLAAEQAAGSGRACGPFACGFGVLKR
eukprot:TRINITY_DN9240_c0_g1_i2.p1 TRINITY_DN9240_c0_g1~~TRINITY_DN9240_c0_g1_i2.p1  ORF type:complete len:367 (+),score=76.91 TRINITY_DN9240_c0_g1_i2:117-1217(+)